MIKKSSQPFARPQKLVIRYFFQLCNLKRHGLDKAGHLQHFIKYMRVDWNVFFNLPLAAFMALVNLCIIC